MQSNLEKPETDPKIWMRTADGRRKPYCSPQLRKFGTLDELTRGNQGPGPDGSGNPLKSAS